MGRSPEDTQAEIENRIAKRGIHLLKKYSEYHKFLSERLFRLNASTFSTADKCIFYIGKKLKRHTFRKDLKSNSNLYLHLFCNLVRYLPLVTPMAKDSMYRTVHPYAAKSTKEFRSWNVGKQLAAEVSGPPQLVQCIPYLSTISSMMVNLRCFCSFFVPALFADWLRICPLSKFT